MYAIKKNFLFRLGSIPKVSHYTHAKHQNTKIPEIFQILQKRDTQPMLTYCCKVNTFHAAFLYLSL